MAKREIERHIRYSNDEYEFVKARAQMLNMPVARYIRYISVHGQIKNYDMQIVQDVRMEMRKIGTNINQIAHLANETHSVSAKDVERLKVQVTALSDFLKKWLKPLD